MIGRANKSHICRCKTDTPLHSPFGRAIYHRDESLRYTPTDHDCACYDQSYSDDGLFPHGMGDSKHGHNRGHYGSSGRRLGHHSAEYPHSKGAIVRVETVPRHHLMHAIYYPLHRRQVSDFLGQKSLHLSSRN